MSNLSDFIGDFVAGDDVDILRDVTGLDEQAVTKAWLTIKRKASDLDADALAQLIITDVSSAAGVITANTARDTAHLLFSLTPAQSILLTKLYYFDIQVLTDAGKLHTPYHGRIRGTVQITIATS